MSFVEVKLRGNRCGFIAVSEIVEVDSFLEEVGTRDGRRLKLASTEALGQLLGRGLVRGLAEADGAFVTVPMTSIDHVADRYDEAGGEWVAVATTAGGVRFVVDVVSRAMLGLDGEVYDIDRLRAAVTRLKGGDVAAEAAVEAAIEAAEEALGGRKVA